MARHPLAPIQHRCRLKPRAISRCLMHTRVVGYFQTPVCCCRMSTSSETATWSTRWRSLRSTWISTRSLRCAVACAVVECTQERMMIVILWILWVMISHFNIVTPKPMRTTIRATSASTTFQTRCSPIAGTPASAAPAHTKSSLALFGHALCAESRLHRLISANECFCA